MSGLLTFDMIAREMTRLVVGFYGRDLLTVGAVGSAEGTPDQITAVANVAEGKLKKSLDDYAEEELSPIAYSIAKELRDNGEIATFELPIPKTAIYASNQRFSGMNVRTVVDWLPGSDKRALRFDVGFVRCD